MKRLLLPVAIWLSAASNLYAASLKTGEEIPLWPQTAPATVTLTVDLPKTPKGAAALLVMTDPAASKVIDSDRSTIRQILLAQGVTVFCLKYYPNHLKHKKYASSSLADSQRAIRMIRGLSGDALINVSKIGVIGFSTGSAIAEDLAREYDKNIYSTGDSIDTISARPDFLAIIAPEMPRNPQENIHNDYKYDINIKHPNTFILLIDDNDHKKSEYITSFYRKLKSAKTVTEMHLFPPNDIGSTENGAGLWPNLFSAWLSRVDGTN
jgi:hypothetical protein